MKHFWKGFQKKANTDITAAASSIRNAFGAPTPPPPPPPPPADVSAGGSASLASRITAGLKSFAGQ